MIYIETLRRHVHSFWYNKTIPTLAKIYGVVKDDITNQLISSFKNNGF